MYSVVLATMLTVGAGSPTGFGHHHHRSVSSCHGYAFSCHGCSGCYGCYGCSGYGCYGGCYCSGWCHGGYCSGGWCHGCYGSYCHGCYGCSGWCGGVVVYPSCSGCGRVANVSV